MNALIGLSNTKWLALELYTANSAGYILCICAYMPICKNGKEKGTNSLRVGGVAGVGGRGHGRAWREEREGGDYLIISQ